MPPRSCEHLEAPFAAAVCSREGCTTRLPRCGRRPCVGCLGVLVACSAPGKAFLWLMERVRHLTGSRGRRSETCGSALSPARPAHRISSRCSSAHAVNAAIGNSVICGPWRPSSRRLPRANSASPASSLAEESRTPHRATHRQHQRPGRLAHIHQPPSATRQRAAAAQRAVAAATAAAAPARVLGGRRLPVAEPHGKSNHEHLQNCLKMCKAAASRRLRRRRGQQGPRSSSGGSSPSSHRWGPGVRVSTRS